MTWREIAKADLATCLEMQPACIGDGLVGRDVARRVWNELLSSPSFLGMVIESERPIGGHRIVACGLGVFVTPGFADQEIAHPQPGLNSRIIANCAAGHGVVMNYHELGTGNAGSGLDFVNMYGTWREDVLSPQEFLEVQWLMGTSFLESHAGYRLNRVLKEAMGAARLELARATRIWSVLAEYPESGSALLRVISREIAFATPYSTAATMYHYREPSLGFRESDQRLLLAALRDATDAQLALKLGVSVSTIKKRWISIFARFEEIKPELLGISPGEMPNEPTRGPQKRHHVLGYVRAHPEELRPYAERKGRGSKDRAAGI
jgi:hypothetical protein